MPMEISSLARNPQLIAESLNTQRQLIFNDLIECCSKEECQELLTDIEILSFVICDIENAFKIQIKRMAI